MTLRVSPVRESAEMILLRPEKGRICLPNRPLRASVAGQYYDFVVDGEVARPGPLRGRVAAVRGPAFYECKSQ
jgi:hypothetical protein